MKKQPLKILDCTLRDGGYYNKWDFDSDLVETYLSAMDQASIDVIEIGFRSPPKNTFMGPFVYSLDNYLVSLPLPEKILIGVMINAQEYLNNSEDPVELINKLFQPKERSSLGLVRIAINFDQALEGEVLADRLKELGYQVGLNLMQAHGKQQHQYMETAKCIAEWKSVDVLYFADSFGNMNPSQITFICNAIMSEWKGSLGIHTHNNKGMALVNSLAALEAGVTWFDATIMGMGRGAGNVTTETLLMEFEHLEIHRGKSQLLIPCLEKFYDLKEKFQWGSNHLYYYAANHNIHPTFVQTLLSDPRFYTEQIFPTLESLAKQPSSSFSTSVLKKAIYGVDSNGKGGDGAWDATGWLENREVLLVGAGSSVNRYSKAILNFIKQHQPIVIFLNTNPYLPNDMASATVLAHESRANFDVDSYLQLNHPLIMPASNLQHIFGKKLDELTILDYGLKIEEGMFSIRPRGCYLHWPLAFAYALSVITQSKAKELYLVGFDGYAIDDIRQEEMNEVFSNYVNLEEQIPFKSLTPTNYRIPQGSVFEPVIDVKDFLLVIPARFRSSRFPGKPLADLCGKSLIRHVWDKCVQAVGAEEVVIATDDESIQSHCLSQGMQVVMTSSQCLTGTDRVCEVALKIKRDIYINVQGDEPLIDSKDILKILDTARSHRDTIINGMCPIEDEEDFYSPNVPKVITTPDRKLIYMSRSPVPTGKKHEFIGAMRQVCIYAFPRNAILEFGRHKEKTKIEEIEDIEILRFLEMGKDVRMVEVNGSPLAVDTPEDLERAKGIINV